MEKMNDLRDLLKHEIEDLQSVEDQILEALPKMIDKANNPDLKKALQEHLQVTEQHKSRLEKIMQNVQPGNEGSNEKKKGILGIFGNGKQVCKGMKGIIEEGEKIMSSDISPEALDAAIIASAQKVEHYEICGYGTARSFAKELGMEQVVKQLEQTLNEEYEADDLLTNLALMRINEEAEMPGGSSPSASSRGRSSGRVKEKANREMEIEPVSSSRSRSSGRNDTANNRTKTNSGTQSSGQPKTSGTPRGETGRSSSNSKRTVSSGRSSKTSASSNGRSSASGRSGASKGNSRGRK